jgi:hypothetical protein
MATTREILEFVIKADGTAAASTFGKLGTQAEQAGKKLDSGLTSSLKGVGTFLGNNLPGLALAGGAAIIGFGLKSADSFAKLALEAGKLSDATGLTTEQSGRFIEVARDVGVSSDTITSAFGKMNKAIGASPQKFADLGITAQDTQGRVLQAIDAINGIADPAAKALLASQLFGRGWQQISELIGEGSSKIKDSLAAVSDVKAIKPEQVEQARTYRASMDQLRDSIEEVGLTIGQSLVPGIAAAAAGIAKLLQSGPVKAALDIVGAGFEAAGESAKNFSDFVSGTANDLPKVTDAAKEGADALKAFADAGSGLTAPKNIAGDPSDIKAQTAAWNDAAEKALFYRDGLEYVAKAQAELDKKTGQSAGLTDQQTQAMKDNATAASEAADKIKALTDADNAHVAAIRDILGLETDLPGKYRDVTAAVADLDQATKDAAKGGKDKAANDAKQADALATLKDKMLTAADAQQQLAEKTAEAGGKTLTARDKQLEFAAGLVYSAGKSKVAQQAALDYVKQLDYIPKDVKTQVTTLVNEGRLPEALNLLRQAEGQHTVTMNVVVRGDLTNFFAVSANAHTGGVSVVRVLHSAGGNYLGAGQPSIVGEQGPELFVPTTAGRVLPHGTGLAGGGSVTINIGTVVANNPGELVTSLEKFVQQSGKGRLQRLVA